jgi:O-antigen/teichoic acid export membrane protein
LRAADRPISARTAAVTVGGQALGRGALLVIGVANTAIITRALGIGTYADWATVLSLFALFSFAMDPGLTSVIVRRLSIPGERAPRADSVLRLKFVLALVVYVLICIAAISLRGFDTAVLAALLALQIFPRAVIGNAQAWLQAHHLVHRQTAYEVGTGVAGTGALLALALIDAPPVALAVAGFVAPAVVLAVFTQRQLRRLPKAAWAPADPASLRSVWHEAAPIAGSVVLLALYTRIDTFFVNIADSAIGVALYLLAYRLIEQTQAVANIIATTALPLLADLASRVDIFRDRRLYEGLLSVTAVGVAISGGLIIAADPLIAVLGGDQFSGGSVFVVLLAPLCGALFVNFYLGYFYIGIGRGRRYLYVNAVGLAVNLAGNAAFTLSYGASAAARVSWVTEFVVVGLNLYPLFRHGRLAFTTCLRVTVLLGALAVAAEVGADGGNARLGGLLVALAAVGLSYPALRASALRIARRPTAG